MNDINSVYIERNNCGDCYRCVRTCAVKAIKIENSSAEIINELCVACGMCVNCCPSGAIKFRDDIWLSRRYIQHAAVKIASLSPSWVTEFPGISASRMIEALKLLGFTYVSEAALGAEKVAQAELAYLQKKNGIHISSRCPAVNDYICKYRSKLAANIIPVYSPMLAHAAMLKKTYGTDAKVVYFSSCIAAKTECSEHPEILDVALTFRELKKWMYDEGVEFDFIKGEKQYTFEPFPAQRGLAYPLEKGNTVAQMLREQGINGVKVMSKSGLYNIDKLLSKLPQNTAGETIYLDLLGCENGCIQSCGTLENKGSIIDKELILLQDIDRRNNLSTSYTLPDSEVFCTPFKPQAQDQFVSEPDTIKALNSIGIYSETEHLNCNGCGYVTCRRFAKALAQGYVDPKMCTHFQYREFEDKFRVLSDKISSGVFVVNQKLRIVEANRKLATLLGPDIEMIYNANPGLGGADITKIIPFHKLIATVLQSGEEQLNRDFQVQNRLLKVSLFSIQKYKLVLVMVSNLYHSDVRNEEIVSRTQQVIKDNLNTVQKIAFLLGENASRTEAILSSILNTHTEEEPQ